MDLDIKGKRALVMGSSKGIGRCVAETLIKEGASVAICARGLDELESTAKEIGAVPFQVDFSVAGAAQKLVSHVMAKLGGVDILIVNTGGPPQTEFHNTTNEQWHEAFQSMMMSSVDVMRACLPGMQKNKWGRVVVITSVGAKESVSNLILSNSIRAGVHGLVNAMSKEYAKEGITVNAVMPGYTLTDRLGDFFKKRNMTADEMASRIVPGRLGKPEETAALITFLASNMAGYINGQAIACDGGIQQSI